jgi:hypothetical protein
MSSQASGGIDTALWRPVGDADADVQDPGGGAGRVRRVRGASTLVAAASSRIWLTDMDGTLVETEHYWDQSLAGLAGRLGGRLSVAARTAMAI